MNEDEMKDLIQRMAVAMEKTAITLAEMERLMALHSELTLKMLENMSASLAYIADATEEKGR